MPALFIKDPETANLATYLAARLGRTKTEVVRDALKAKVEAEALGGALTSDGTVERYLKWQAKNPLPPATGRTSDKAFFDEMWGEV